MRIELRYTLSILIISTQVLTLASLLSLVNCEPEGWQVDVFTQKHPYNGKGSGQPSDAFAPNDRVILYANLTYNMYPVQSILVTFQIAGPLNPIENVTLVLTKSTNTTGIAEVNFTIPFPAAYPETVTFGSWKVQASTPNASDTLTFTVGWLLEVDVFGVAEYDPPQGGFAAFNLIVRNIAMTPRNATLIITILDYSLNNIGSIILTSIAVEPGLTNLTQIFHVPRSATVGMAKANVVLLTPSGSVYSPSRSATFLITFIGDLNLDGKVDIDDMAVETAAFGSYPVHPRWVPIADVNKDLKVDILDAALVSLNFGKAIPGNLF